MSNFISGGAVDCGPSTALKDVSALVERDYGVQRVSTFLCRVLGINVCLKENLDMP